MNPLEEDEGKTFDEQPRENHCAYPVHKGVRIYLWQRDSKIPTEQVFKFLKQVDKNFSEHLKEVERRLICPICLCPGSQWRQICPSCLCAGSQTTSDEGFFYIDARFDLADNIRAATCSAGHMLPTRLYNLFILKGQARNKGNTSQGMYKHHQFAQSNFSSFTNKRSRGVGNERSLLIYCGR